MHAIIKPLPQPSSLPMEPLKKLQGPRPQRGYIENGKLAPPAYVSQCLKTVFPSPSGRRKKYPSMNSSTAEFVALPSEHHWTVLGNLLFATPADPVRVSASPDSLSMPGTSSLVSRHLMRILWMELLFHCSRLVSSTTTRRIFSGGALKMDSVETAALLRSLSRWVTGEVCVKRGKVEAVGSFPPSSSGAVCLGH